ncbi:hypothetical protein PV939_11240 [Ligilactobacillus salivarius]|nr:hypothetical protein [Ligilactobacillus salivarius]
MRIEESMMWKRDGLFMWARGRWSGREGDEGRTNGGASGVGGGGLSQ